MQRHALPLASNAMSQRHALALASNAMRRLEEEGVASGMSRYRHYTHTLHADTTRYSHYTP